VTLNNVPYDKVTESLRRNENETKTIYPAVIGRQLNCFFPRPITAGYIVFVSFSFRFRFVLSQTFRHFVIPSLEPGFSARCVKYSHLIGQRPARFFASFSSLSLPIGSNWPTPRQLPKQVRGCEMLVLFRKSKNRGRYGQTVTSFVKNAKLVMTNISLEIRCFSRRWPASAGQLADAAAAAAAA